MTSATQATNPILRDPAEQEVSPLELLFDLVFVSHPRARRMVIAMMFAGLFLNASLTRGRVNNTCVDR